MGSSSNKGLFALIAQKEFIEPETAEGQAHRRRRRSATRPYNYTVALLGNYGLGVRDVQWIPVGTDVTGRAAALQTNRADATLLTAPNYFRLEEAGYKNLANLADHEVFAATDVHVQRRARSRPTRSCRSRSSRRTPRRSSASTTTRRSR